VAEAGEKHFTDIKLAMNNPLVSIIIPCYNAKKTITKTLVSVFNQSYQPLEILAVNDGSTDSTPDILQKYSQQVKLFYQDNKGASAARNRGFRESTGQYLLFCDSDVELKPDMVKKMVAMLEEHPEKAYCYCNFRFGYHTFDLFPFDAVRLQKENYISTMSLIRRDCFLGFDESLRRFQDWDLWKRMLKKGYTGLWCPERLFSAPLSRQGISQFSLGEIITTVKNKFFSK
jgi:glycosyltransferase involved in cell wall biosynthesis